MTKLHEWPLIHHRFDLPVRYYRRDSSRTAGVVICLHGYQDHALSMVRRLGWSDRDDLPFTLIAVNAPFPVPIWTEGKFTEAYAWYFNDATRGIAVGSPAAAADAIADIMKKESLDTRATVICGFSQGGLLAPVLASRLPAARAIVGIGTGYPAELYRNLESIDVHALHGVDDETWPIAAATDAHRSLAATGKSGTFTALEGVRHRLTPLVGNHVVRVAAEYL
jgi:predicted esterase